MMYLQEWEKCGTRLRTKVCTWFVPVHTGRPFEKYVLLASSTYFFSAVCTQYIPSSYYSNGKYVPSTYLRQTSGKRTTWYLWISRHILRTIRDILCYTTSRLVLRCLFGRKDISGYPSISFCQKDILWYLVITHEMSISVDVGLSQPEISNFLCRYISI
jgi:hypothetical protein